MTPKAQQVLRQALRLPPRARADIASTLLHSLDDNDDPDAAEAWAAEIDRRVKDVESGKVRLIAWTQARRSLRAGLGRAKAKA
jgi:putative addiction module component (TIGR02574 family)